MSSADPKEAVFDIIKSQKADMFRTFHYLEEEEKKEKCAARDEAEQKLIEYSAVSKENKNAVAEVFASVCRSNFGGAANYEFEEPYTLVFYFENGCVYRTWCEPMSEFKSFLLESALPGLQTLAILSLHALKIIIPLLPKARCLETLHCQYSEYDEDVRKQARVYDEQFVAMLSTFPLLKKLIFEAEFYYKNFPTGVNVDCLELHPCYYYGGEGETLTKPLCLTAAEVVLVSPTSDHFLNSVPACETSGVKEVRCQWTDESNLGIAANISSALRMLAKVFPNVPNVTLKVTNLIWKEAFQPDEMFDYILRFIKLNVQEIPFPVVLECTLFDKDGKFLTKENLNLNKME